MTDDTIYDITAPVDGEDTHALHSSVTGRKRIYWRACDQVDVPRELVALGYREDVTCEACLGAWG